MLKILVNVILLQAEKKNKIPLVTCCKQASKPESGVEVGEVVL